MGNSLDEESTKSFLDFNSIILGRPLTSREAISLVTCVVTIADGVERRFIIDIALALGGPLKVKLYKCYIDYTTLLI